MHPPSSSCNTARRLVLLAAALSGGPACCAAFNPGAAAASAHGGRARRPHQPLRPHPRGCTARRDAPGGVESSIVPLELSADVDFGELFVMDVVLFARRNESGDDDATSSAATTATTLSNCKLELGAVQENGNVAPLSTWTLESAYSSDVADMLEFVVDEEDLVPGLTSEEIRVLKVLDGELIGYGSRQVGGGKGPGNPHGEESELLYYIDRGVVEGTYGTVGSGDGAGEGKNMMTIDITVNPGLEHLW
ncbi:hypothetical protein ACHAXT_011310 [Thalassiosira profunda]